MTYDPNVGQFISLDPSESLGENWAPVMMGHTPDPTNSYRYAGNDPVDNVDPTGLYLRRVMYYAWEGYPAFEWGIEKPSFQYMLEFDREDKLRLFHMTRQTEIIATDRNGKADRKVTGIDATVLYKLFDNWAYPYASENSTNGATGEIGIFSRVNALLNNNQVCTIKVQTTQKWGLYSSAMVTFPNSNKPVRYEPGQHPGGAVSIQYTGPNGETTASSVRIKAIDLKSNAGGGSIVVTTTIEKGDDNKSGDWSSSVKWTMFDGTYGSAPLRPALQARQAADLANMNRSATGTVTKGPSGQWSLEVD